MIDVEKHLIALIKKTHPPAQAGLLNGIGGKVDTGEGIFHAMTREFREETGVLWTEWTHTKTFIFDDHKVMDTSCRIDVFYSLVDSTKIRLKSMTEEVVQWHDWKTLTNKNTVDGVMEMLAHIMLGDEGVHVA